VAVNERLFKHRLRNLRRAGTFTGKHPGQIESGDVRRMIMIVILIPTVIPMIWRNPHPSCKAMKNSFLHLRPAGSSHGRSGMSLAVR